MVEFAENSDSVGGIDGIGKVVGGAGVLAPVEGAGAMSDSIGVDCTVAMSWAGATSGGVDVGCVMSMLWAITGSIFLVGTGKPASSLVGIEPMCRSAG